MAKEAPPARWAEALWVKRGLYWVEEEKLGTVASGHQSAQGSSPSASLATAATASSRSLVNWREVSP